MIKHEKVLLTHPLASQRLRDLLSAVMPTTRQEEDALAALARAYQKMGTEFPTEKLRDEVEGLYAYALSLMDGASWLIKAADSLLSAVKLRKSGLARVGMPETDGLKVVIYSLPNLSAVLEHCHQLSWFAIAAAARLIEAALKAAKKR